MKKSAIKDEIFITGLPEVDSHFWKQNRKLTYSNWPFKKTDKCNLERMAAAGFYIIGDSNEPDLVECFICGKQLDGWESDDDPWNEHKKHQPSCPFVKLNKQDEKEWTIDELYDLFKKYQSKQLMDQMKNDFDTVKEAIKCLMSELSICKMSQKNKKSID